MRCRRWLPESEVLYLFFQWSRQPSVPTLGHETRGVRLTCNGMIWLGVCHDKAILGASDPLESLQSCELQCHPLSISSNPSCEWSGMATIFGGG